MSIRGKGLVNNGDFNKNLLIEENTVNILLIAFIEIKTTNKYLYEVFY